MFLNVKCSVKSMLYAITDNHGRRQSHDTHFLGLKKIQLHGMGLQVFVNQNHTKEIFSWWKRGGGQ